MANINSTLDKNNAVILFNGVTQTVTIQIPRNYPAGSEKEQDMVGIFPFSSIGNLVQLRAEILTMINSFITSKGGVP